MLVFICVMPAMQSTTMVTRMIEPYITEYDGGWGFKCKIVNASTNYTWKIELSGKHILNGKITNGTLPSSGWIRTPIFPPAFGFGKINITVTLYRSDGWHSILGMYDAFMPGPIIIFIIHNNN